MHEERDLEALRKAVPGIIFQAIPATYFLWMESDHGNLGEDPRHVTFWESPPCSSPRQFRRLLVLLRHHPCGVHVRKTANWGPLRLSDFWSEEKILASALYRDYYHRTGTGWRLGCCTFRAGRMGALNLGQPLKARDFSERDCYMLRLLVPHFVQALQAAEATSARRQAQSCILLSLGLTPREIEVALWLARGRTNPEIAVILATRPRTVEKHVEKILLKLGAENRTAAAAVVTGMVPVDARPTLTLPPARARTRR